MSFIEEKSRMIRERGARDRAARGKAGFWDELRVIPVPARIIAVLAYAGVVTLIVTLFYLKPHDWENWNSIEMTAFAALIPIFASLYVLLIGYVNGDAKRRGMRRVMWTLLAILIPNAIGVILYFLMRDPLSSSCPSCGKRVGGSYAFCPHCGTNLAPSCTSCKHAVEPGWANCAYCGTKLGGGGQAAA
jgi:Double zinc ribbon